MSNKNSWYRNRILWSANKQLSSQHSCFIYPNIPDVYREHIHGADNLDFSGNYVIVPNFIPLITMWGNRFLWTFVSESEIHSCYLNKRSHVKLADLRSEIKLVHEPDASQIEIKFKTSKLIVDDKGSSVWAPPGPPLYALLNILQMIGKINKTSS